MPALRVIEYKASQSTNPTSLGSAVARSFLHDAAVRVDVSAVGPNAVNTTAKAICYARRFMQEKKFDLVVVMSFGSFESTEGDKMMKIIFQCYRSDDMIHLKFITEDQQNG